MSFTAAMSCGVLQVKAKHFQAGQITGHIEQWRKLTSDPEILETVAGQSIEFTQTPVQIKPPFQPK